MAKELKSKIASESEAFEIIETSIDDLDVLKRAFDLIKEVCEELDEPLPAIEENYSKSVLN